MPYLMVLGSGYIIMDRVMFSGKLTGLIIEGWRSKMRRLFIRSVRMIVALHPALFSTLLPAMQAADPRKILDTVAWNEGMAGHEGEVSPESQKEGDGRDSFASANETTDRASGVVDPKHYDRVFTDSRLESDPKRGDEWENPVSAKELDMGSTYNGPDDDNETGDADYKEMNTAFDYVLGREQTSQERDLAQRIIRNLKGTPALADMEQMTVQIGTNIKKAVKEQFADVRPKDKPLDGFDLNAYM
jgi:hypothetical protein